MIEFHRLHHVGIPARDQAAMMAFYTGILGFKAHRENGNWLLVGNAFSVHLMPSRDPARPVQIAQHLALEVASLADLVATLLGHGLKPYQASLKGEIRPIVDVGQALDFGIGTVFVEDPENNVLEFVQGGKGIYATVNHDVD